MIEGIVTDHEVLSHTQPVGESGVRTVLWPILRRALSQPRSIAVVDDQRTWRYIDLVGGALHLARYIQQASSSRHVGVLLPTGGAFPMTMLATWMLGRTLVPINYLLSASERQYITDHAALDLVVTAGRMLEFLGEAPRGVTLMKLDELSFKGIPPLRFPAIASADDLAAILYTSGTSGKPKGVMLTHENLRSNIGASAEHIELTRADCFLGVLPQFHSFGLTALTILPLAVGSKTVYTARFVPKQIVELFRKHKPDIFMGIPQMYSALLTSKDAAPEDFASLRLAVSGGGPLPMATFDQFRERFGVAIHEGYGLTETSPVVSMNQLHHHRIGSVGRLIPGCSARVLDDRGNDVAAGEEGEIALAGPNIMTGYYKQPELTAEVIRPDGYFVTGDWGKLDADGYLHITGRKKEMLIIGGENVFPREIEEVLDRHETVAASAVIGREDPVRGELPIAFVEMVEGAAFDEPALRAYCRQHLAGFKVPREILLVDNLPRNPTGKILRRELIARQRGDQHE